MSFSLKTLFIAVTVAAILLAIFFALPAEISTFVCTLISVVAPAGFVSWIVYGRGYGRAFAIGCTAASAILLFSTSLGILLTMSLAGLGASEGSAMVPTIPVYQVQISPASEGKSGLGSVLMVLVESPFPLGFSLVLLSGGLSVLVRWLTLRQRCLLE